MRRSFEQSLGGYTEIARKYEEAKKEGEFIEAEQMVSVVDFRLDQEARRNRTDRQTQEAILETQKYKQEIMTALHERFKAIERKEQQEVLKGQRLVTMKDGKFVWDTGTDKGEVQVTLGALLTDQEWGIEYVLDVESMPRQIQKRFAIEQAKFQLRELLNEQIVLNETGTVGVPNYLVDIYNDRVEKINETRPGFLAERGVRNFLKKMVIDHGLPIDVLDTDIFEDVIQGIDFSIHSRAHSRGVNVEPGNEHQTHLGFQFTILNPNTHESEILQYLEFKKKKIQKIMGRVRYRLEGDNLKVDDILLMVIPSKAYTWAFKRWQEFGAPPGGPDRFWSKEIRAEILRYVLVKFMSEEKTEEFIDQLKELQKDDRFGSKRFRVAPQLMIIFPNLQERALNGVDLQDAFQQLIASAEQKSEDENLKGIKPIELFRLLNNVLDTAGLREIDPNNLDSIPPELSDFLSKAASFSDLRVRQEFIINKLFPSRSG